MNNSISLRPSTPNDKKMVYEWSHNTDSGQFLVSLLDEPENTFDQWCDDWKEYYFTDDTPELGRLFIIQDRNEPIGAIAYNDIDDKNRVELDIWLRSYHYCGKGYGPKAIQLLCDYLYNNFQITTFMMQPSSRNPRAIKAYEKAGFVKQTATTQQIKDEWGGVDHHDNVLMVCMLK